jgi:uncharacterized protein (TIGR02145 family)
MNFITKFVLLSSFLLLEAALLPAQVGVGTATPTSKLEVVGAGTTSATTALKVGNASSTILTVRNDGLVEISSTTQGFLPPRMSTNERNAIASPATGLVIFNTTTSSLETRKSTGWVSLSESFVALPTIVIGNQQWMEKNLEVTSYRNGELIPEVSGPTAWATLTTGAWCWYDNDPANGAIYGKLYNWYAVADPRGLCPAGWHVPSDAEWTTLGTTLGGTSVAGAKMKSTSSLWTTSNTPGDNSSGFAGLPGGSRGITPILSPPYITSYSLSVRTAGGWWSSTEGSQNSTNAYLAYVNHNLASYGLNADEKKLVGQFAASEIS